MVNNIKSINLFSLFTNEEINELLKKSFIKLEEYNKDEYIFMQGDLPKDILILVEGSVMVAKDKLNGERSIIAIFENIGEMFGEIFFFLNKKYDFYAKTNKKTTILRISKAFIYEDGSSLISSKLKDKLLNIFAKKVFYLNTRVNILLHSSLREKISKFLLFNMKDKEVNLSMNREELADFLNTTRPSLSRELMNMKSEGLIAIDKNRILILDENKL